MDVSTAYQHSFTDAQSIRAEVKRLFKFEREMVLSKLPMAYKRSFRQVAFVRKRPVLIVSPYDVPPGPIRAMWMNKFEEVSRENQLDGMPHLVYHYGSQDLQSAYSLPASSEDIVPFSLGEKLNLNQIPKHIQFNLLKGEVLHPDDEFHFRALSEMTRDLNLPPEERRRGFTGFAEIYELITIAQQRPQEHDEGSDLRVGSRVSVLWDGDHLFYTATITEKRQDFFFLQYDDGDREWLPLKEHTYRLVGADAENVVDKVVPTAKTSLSPTNTCRQRANRLTAQSIEDGAKDPHQTTDPNRVPGNSEIAGEATLRKQNDRSQTNASRIIAGDGHRSSFSKSHGDVDHPRKHDASGCNAKGVSITTIRKRPEASFQHGFRRPRNPPRKLIDGTFAPPAGRPPSRMEWNRTQGVWVPEKRCITGYAANEKSKKPRLSAITDESSAQSIVHSRPSNDDILVQVPARLRDLFGQMGFASHRGFDHLPLLIVSPVCVPAIEWRNRWMEMFKKAKAKETWLGTLPVLVYWYGGEKRADSRQTSFSLVKQTDIVLWEEGVARGYHRMVSTDAQKTSICASQWHDAIEEANKDLRKKPAHRMFSGCNYPLISNENTQHTDIWNATRAENKAGNWPSLRRPSEGFTNKSGHLSPSGSRPLKAITSSESLLELKEVKSGELEAPIAEPSQLKVDKETLATVTDIKDRLEAECLSNSENFTTQCIPLLDKLDRCDITDVILQKTLIGKTVSQLKTNNILKPKARKLIKKWKKVHCDAMMISTVGKWKVAVDASDASSVDSLLKDFLKELKNREKISGNFLKDHGLKTFSMDHGLEALMMETESLLVERRVDRTYFEELFQLLGCGKPAVQNMEHKDEGTLRLKVESEVG